MKKIPFLLVLSLMVFSLLGLGLSNLAHTEDVTQRVIITAVQDAEWNSYRHAYKASVFYETFTRSRPLIQAHMQLRPLKDVSLQGLVVQLAGEKTNLDIAVDSMGRASIPLLKQAFDEDAVLRLNRPKGQFYFSGRYSIKEREDGKYAASDLRTACEQLISAQRESGDRIRLLGKRCAGIKFVYAPENSEAVVNVNEGSKLLQGFHAVDAYPFEDNSMALYKVVIYRFADAPAQGVVVPAAGLLAIGTLYE